MKHVVLGGVAVYRIVGSYSPNSFFKASAHGFVGNTGGIGSFDVTCMCSVNVNPTYKHKKIKLKLYFIV